MDAIISLLAFIVLAPLGFVLAGIIFIIFIYVFGYLLLAFEWMAKLYLNIICGALYLAKKGIMWIYNKITKKIVLWKD